MRLLSISGIVRVLLCAGVPSAPTPDKADTTVKALRAQSKARTNAKLARWMGGKSAPSKTEMGEDGRPTAKRAAAQSVSVEGKAARPRLDRPGRKMGGRLKRDDGGSVPPQDRHPPGELSNVEQNKYLKKEAAKEPMSVGNPNALATGAGAAGLFKAVTAKHPIGKAIGAAIGAGGASRTPALGRDYDQMKKSIQAKYESEKFDKAEREDRDEGAGKKRGGKVSK